tara:strand:+ start:1129 stop:1320 length:192 start_codon:yes stop_codon:yes gene_type:complete
MPKEKKRADNVGSARSRKGQVEQDKMTAEISQLAGRLAEVLGEEFIQVEVEPILKKLDKKKLN